MSHSLYDDTTPAEVKNAKVIPLMSIEDEHSADSGVKGLHLITMSTPNGQKVQIMLEELADIYGTEWTTTKMSVTSYPSANHVS